MTSEVIKKLSEAALDVRKKAYCRTPALRWARLLLAKSGEIYTGVNIENAAFTPTNCAERTAFFTAIAKGERDFVAVAIAGRQGGRGARRLLRAVRRVQAGDAGVLRGRVCDHSCKAR